MAHNTSKSLFKGVLFVSSAAPRIYLWNKGGRGKFFKKNSRFVGWVITRYFGFNNWMVTKADGKISAEPHTTLCIQFLNRENND